MAYKRKIPDISDTAADPASKKLSRVQRFFSRLFVFSGKAPHSKSHDDTISSLETQARSMSGISEGNENVKQSHIVSPCHSKLADDGSSHREGYGEHRNKSPSQGLADFNSASSDTGSPGVIPTKLRFFSSDEESHVAATQGIEAATSSFGVSPISDNVSLPVPKFESDSDDVSLPVPKSEETRANLNYGNSATTLPANASSNLAQEISEIDVESIVKASKSLPGAPSDAPDEIWEEEAKETLSIWSDASQDKVALSVLRSVHDKMTIKRTEMTIKRTEMTIKRTEMILKRTEMTIKEAEILRKSSFRATYTKDVGSEARPCFPKLLLVDSIKPSVRSKDRKGHQIPSAELIEVKNAWMNPEDIKIPVRNISNQDIPSSIGAKCLDGPLTYCNENHIQAYCLLVVEEAIRSLGLSDIVKCRMETSLYSMIPDIIVLEIDGRIIFVIEVKCPETTTIEVFRNCHVGGQGWLYLMAMRQHGCKRPLGAIMTFNKIMLISLSDPTDNPDHPELLKHVGSLESVIRTVANNVDKKPKLSPFKEFTKVNKNNLPKVNKGSFNDDKDQEEKAIVYCSEVVGGDHVFAHLLQGLLVAYKDNVNQKLLPRLPIVDHGDCLGRRLFYRMSEEHGVFVTTRSKLKANSNKFPTDRVKYFYMLSYLGSGKDGTGYVSCGENGHLCTVKLYNSRPSRQNLPEDREKEWEETVRELKVKRDEEAQRWKDIYRKRYAVRTKMLGGIPSLVMPYGRELKQGERSEALDEIRDVLTKFAKMGYAYTDEDLRWRHILRDSGKEIFLVDLRSLGTIPQGTVVEDIVQDQIDKLVERSGETTPSKLI